MKEQPKEITVCNLEVVLMPQGEVICQGKTVGWFKDLKKFLTIKEKSEKGESMAKKQSKIEVIRLHRLDNEGPIKAFADLSFDDTFVVKAFKVVEGKDGLFVSMPSEMGKSGRWFNTFVPLTKEAQAQIEQAIIEAYEA